MSYDLSVQFSKWPADAAAAWTGELARMGVEVEFHPRFDPPNDANWCPVALCFDPDTPLPIEPKLREFGRFASGFEFYPSRSGASFMPKASDGSLAAFVCACALAALTEGEVYDLQTGERASGTTGLEVLECFFPEGTLMQGPRPPIRFIDRDDERAAPEPDTDDEEDDEGDEDDEDDDDVEEEL